MDTKSYIIDLENRGLKPKIIAEKTKVNVSTIYRIRQGKSNGSRSLQKKLLTIWMYEVGCNQ